MRKIFLILTFGLTNLYSGQDFDTGLSKPIASVSSLSTYTNSPVSFATGVPDISFPIVSLSTNSKDITAGISISYHPKNLLSSEKASEVGLGWSLLGTNGVISREIIKDLDEKYSDASKSNYVKNEFDDIYYYNIGGYAGKFKVIRDIANNTFQLIKLTPSNLKIEYTRDSNTATLIFNSFTITDDKGYKYLFDKYAISEYKGYGSNGIDYKSAFFLTKIYDYKLQELVSMDYQIDTYTSPLTLKTFQNYKLKKVWSKDNGTIEFNYTYIDAYKSSMNDPYEVNSIILKNQAGAIISKSEFIYNTFSLTNPTNFETSIWKRILWKIKKYGSDTIKAETTEFEYNTTGNEKEYSPIPGQFKDYFLCDFTGSGSSINEIENPKYFSYGALKKIKLPTGGAVEYNFEANEFAVDNLETAYIPNLGIYQFVNPQFQYLKHVSTINFDTKLSRTYSFTLSPTIQQKAVYIKFTPNEIYPYPPLFDPGDGSQPIIDYSVLGAEYGGINGTLCIDSDSGITTTRITLPGGNYTIQIYGPTGGKGQLEIYEMALKDSPHKNAIVNRGQGIRVESIRHYETHMSQTPIKSTKFFYDEFNDPNRSSGEQLQEGSYMGEPIATIVYKNVKILDSENNGYTKYYFRSPSFYPKETVPSDYQFWPNINITKSGLLEKKEIYDNNNYLITSDQFDYTLLDMDTPKYIPIENGDFKTKTAWIKEQRGISKVYDKNGRVITTSSESIKSENNFNLISEKATHADGSVLETFYKYATDKNHTALINANIVGTPLETEIKKNGKTISKGEVRYDNPLHLYPTSVISTNPNDNSTKTAIRYDVYDGKGNVKQYTTIADEATGQGVPTTIIWGYNDTMPIAKVEGATLNDVGSLMADIVAKSNADTDSASEKLFIQALDAFRTNTALKDFRITTYTYDPLIGTTSVTPPNGIREMYQYDSNNRLKTVVDVNGNILKDYRYNTKPQP